MRRRSKTDTSGALRTRGILLALLIAAAGALAASWLWTGFRGGERSMISAHSEASLELKFPAFRSSTMPRNFTCDGADRSPALAWSGATARTRSYALTAIDPDAPGGAFVHWLLYNVPASAASLPDGIAPMLSDGSRQGKNDFGNLGYGGPCPPPGAPHHYVFTLFALDTELDLPPGATHKQLENAMKGHIVGRGEVTVLYGR